MARMQQEHPGQATRPQEWPQARQERAQVAVELQEVWVVAQPLEAKVSGVAKPPLWAAELPQLWVSSSAQPPRDTPVQHMPPNFLASRVLVDQQPPLPPLRWLHLFLGRPT